MWMKPIVFNETTLSSHVYSPSAGPHDSCLWLQQITKKNWLYFLTSYSFISSSSLYQFPGTEGGGWQRQKASSLAESSAIKA